MSSKSFLMAIDNPDSISSQVCIPSTSDVEVTSIALENPEPLMYSQSSPFMALIKSMSPNTGFP